MKTGGILDDLCLCFNRSVARNTHHAPYRVFPALISTDRADCANTDGMKWKCVEFWDHWVVQSAKGPERYSPPAAIVIGVPFWTFGVSNASMHFKLGNNSKNTILRYFRVFFEFVVEN